MTVSEFAQALAERAGAAAVEVPAELVEPLFAYLQLLRRWNRTINLTALPVDPPTGEALQRLLIEPLAAAQKLGTNVDRWFDLGSGGGSPAIPMRLVLRQAELTMVESRSRKAAFLRECIRELHLTDCDVRNARFETLIADKTLSGSADLITARAVRIDAIFLQVCASLLRPGGVLVPIGYRGSIPFGFVPHPRIGFRRECST